jgi:hypothetical protein
MHRRLILAGLAATGGLFTSAFLQVAVAAADLPSADGVDAFTIGGYTFDPYSIDASLGSGAPPVEGWTDVYPLSGASPVLEIGGGTILGDNPIALQDFDVYNPTTGAELGSIVGNETVTSLFGMTSTEFTVASDAPATGGSASDMPAVGTVYDEFNLGNGYENVYTATPGPDGTVTDTLVTPSGNINLDSLFGGFDAAAPMQPGDAFTGLDVSGITGAPDAFSIGGVTLDPILATGGEGFNGIIPVGGVAPLLEFGGTSVGNPDDAIDDWGPQTFDVYSGSGSGATDVGTITTGEDVTDLLGITSTQIIVTGATPADAGDAGDLPTVGSVYDAYNLGGGIENVYTAIPGTAGAPDTVTDTLVTPFGNINLDSLFTSIDAAAPMHPGDAFTGLEAGDSSIGADAFTIGGTTFDPITSAGTEGYDPAYQLLGAEPLLELGGGTAYFAPGIIFAPDQQDFDVYSGSGSGATEVGSIAGNQDVTNLLGMTNTEFTVFSTTPDAGASASDLPAVGSVYDAFNFGDGITNVYTAIPGADGGTDTVTDELVTPWGDYNLDSLFGSFDAVAPLNPGDAFGAGLDAATAAATEAGTSAAAAIDPLSFLGL